MGMRPATQLVGFAVLLLLLGILVPASSHADIYAWTDADGVRHFANKPPPGNAATVWLRQEIHFPAAAGQRDPADVSRRRDQRAPDVRYRSKGPRRAQANATPSRPRAIPRPAFGSRQMAAFLPERNDRPPPQRDRRVRRRPSKRERGESSGLLRVVRAIPSPYYMGYRPVYSRSSGYRSGRGRQGIPNVHRGMGRTRGSGKRARTTF
jgi:hypothetical protein